MLLQVHCDVRYVLNTGSLLDFPPWPVHKVIAGLVIHYTMDHLSEEEEIQQVICIPYKFEVIRCSTNAESDQESNENGGDKAGIIYPT